MSEAKGTGGKKKRTYRSHLTRNIVLRYFLAMFGCNAVFLFVLFFGWQFASSLTWQAQNPIYRVLIWVREYIMLVILTVCFVIWVVLTVYYLCKPLHYLEEIVEASRQLAVLDDKPIVLSEEIKEVQDRLNQIRAQSLRNARLAKEAEQRKNDLIVYLAHDLKTPLTSVIGYLNLLADEPQIGAALRERYTGIALRKALRLEELINEFFDITRFNLTALTLETERTNLSRMLEQMTSEFEPILEEKELTWQRKLAPEVYILCDRDKMERVLDNLIRNAVNYSYSQSAIFVSLRILDGQAEICFHNHGKNIPPEKLARIFEQFFRVDSARASATGGAGLGLAISKEIVELHGGSIQAESEAESVCFTVLLPAIQKEKYDIYVADGAGAQKAK